MKSLCKVRPWNPPLKRLCEVKQLDQLSHLVHLCHDALQEQSFKHVSAVDCQPVGQFPNRHALAADLKYLLLQVLTPRFNTLAARLHWKRATYTWYAIEGLGFMGNLEDVPCFR